MSANSFDGCCRQIEAKLKPITFSCVSSLFCTLNIFEEIKATYDQKIKISSIYAKQNKYEN